MMLMPSPDSFPPSRERKWKMGQAKKFSKKVATSEKNLVLRETTRQREEALQIRKKAAWIGKEVQAPPIASHTGLAFPVHARKSAPGSLSLASCRASPKAAPLPTCLRVPALLLTCE